MPSRARDRHQEGEKSTPEERSIVSLTRSLTKRPWLTSRAARKWLWNWNMKFMCQLTPLLTIWTSRAHVSFPIDETQRIKGWLMAQCRAIVRVTFFFLRLQHHRRIDKESGSCCSKASALVLTKVVVVHHKCAVWIRHGFHVNLKSVEFELRRKAQLSSRGWAHTHESWRR